MKFQAIFWCSIAAGMVMAAAPADAAVQVFGNSQAHECFMAAKAGVHPDSGIEICTAALRDDQLNTHDRAGTYVNRGVLHSAKGRIADAMADYESSLKLMPDLGDAYVNRGAALISLKHYDDALADINKGISLGLSYPQLGYYNRAVAEELMGRFQESYYDFKHALELEPDFALANEQLKNFTVVKKSPSS